MVRKNYVLSTEHVLVPRNVFSLRARVVCLKFISQEKKENLSTKAMDVCGTRKRMRCIIHAFRRKRCKQTYFMQKPVVKNQEDASKQCQQEEERKFNQICRN